MCVNYNFVRFAVSTIALNIKYPTTVICVGEYVERNELAASLI